MSQFEICSSPRSVRPSLPLSAFGAEAIGQLTIPHHLAPHLSGYTTDDKPVAPDPEDGGFTFRIGESRFRYDRLGLQRV